MGKKSIHTVPHGDGWANRREGNHRVSAKFDTQKEAAAAGREAARHDGVEHFIHRPTGQIRDRNSYGNDPHPPRG